MVWFTFTDSSNETFVIRLDDPAAIAHARGLLAGLESADPRIGGIVIKSPVDYNIGWSYHLDPNSIFFFEVAAEVGDSTMRLIEDLLPEVGGAFLPGSLWTGWSSLLLDELRAQSGGAGRDVLVGSRGADILFGEAGNDKLFGRGGDDHLVAGTGADKGFGGAGHDKLGGGAGDDVLFGDGGRDILVGDGGHDRLHGGAGDDKAFGGRGRDILLGDGGDDQLRGGAGDDKVFGGRGRDILVGDDGGDQLRGGAGQDRLDGGAGKDCLMGGRGSDTFVFAPGAGADTITEFVDGRGAADDRIDVSAYRFDSVREIGIAQDGADVVLTFKGGDTVRLTNYLVGHALADLGANDFIL